MEEIVSTALRPSNCGTELTSVITATAEVMSNAANAAKGRADKSIKKETQGLEHSIWAFDTVTARPARQQEHRQPVPSSASSVSRLPNLRGGDCEYSLAFIRIGTELTL